LGNLVSYILKGIIPIIIVLVVLYGVIMKVKVYECFVEGARDGITICLKIFPYLLAMIIAVNVFRASGVLDFFIYLVKPVVKFIGLPPELVPLVLIKPLSGSGALGVFTDIIKQYGPDSYYRVRRIYNNGLNGNNLLYIDDLFWRGRHKKH